MCKQTLRSRLLDRFIFFLLKLCSLLLLPLSCFSLGGREKKPDTQA